MNRSLPSTVTHCLSYVMREADGASAASDAETKQVDTKTNDDTASIAQRRGSARNKMFTGCTSEEPSAGCCRARESHGSAIQTPDLNGEATSRPLGLSTRRALANARFRWADSTTK